MSADKPMVPVVLGSGPLADEMRAMIAADPDSYRPTTWSMSPVGKCPCCSEKVYRCTTRHTGWKPGFATHADAVHPSFNDQGKPDPNGGRVGCCCKEGAWGPKHAEQAKPKRKPKKARKR